MKKLTAGIFTALLGLVTVNAANAAIPSTNYVDGLIEDVRGAFRDADIALDNKITTNANAIGTVGSLTTNEKTNTVGAINEINEAYKTADTNLLNTKIGTDAMGDIQTGTEVTDVVKPTTLTQAVNALNEKIDFKTNGIATDAALGTLQNTVDGHGEDISDLEGRMDTAESEIDTLQGNVQALTNADTAMDTAIKANTQAITNHATDTTNALALKADKSALGALAAKDTVATSDLDSTLQTAVAQVATNKSGIESLNTTVGTKAAQSDVTALTTRVTTAEGAINTLASEKADETSVVERLAQKATVASVDAVADKADANEAAISTLGTTKLNVSEHEADQVLITDGEGNVTTAAQIANTQVSGLGGLATKTTIADADVADGAAIAQSKIAGLTTSLSDLQTNKVTIPTATGADGNYVLTATVVGDQTTYKWELIERNMPVEN